MTNIDSNSNRLEVDIAGIKFKNPVIGASGTFGFGREYSNYIDLNKLGGISVKGLTIKPRKGNKPPRIAETPAGILNSIGLQNPGVEVFIKEELPFLKKFNTVIIANIAGNVIEEYCELAEILSDTDIDAFELNVSCPNVKEGCVAFGNTVEGISEITKQVRKYCKKPLIVKLTPSVMDIKEIALAAEANGADAVSLINTILGMVIDIHKKRPVLANNFGGLSGPAVKPIAVRMTYEVSQTVKIPVIGMGGISSGDDAVEFMLAGAHAVMVGTWNFVNPNACIEVIEGIEKYLERYNYCSIYDIIGKLELNG
ncbi:MAG: dihydroorotate dehydrogenase [Firmicutes bacterium]|nr:dihydroorotate dehydrogenase [Bacillota bacterium]